MTELNGRSTDTDRYCAYCGEQLRSEDAAIERFGEPFCSERHAEKFSEGVRTARMQAARDEAPAADHGALSRRGRRAGTDSWKGALGWGLPLVLVLLVAIPFVWGGWTRSAAAGGTFLLTVLLLALCPLAMYFMMRNMGGMHDSTHDRDTSQSRNKKD